MFTKNSTAFNLVILFLMLVATSATVYEVQHQQTVSQQAAALNTCNKIAGQYCSSQICTNVGSAAGLGHCPATLPYCCKIAAAEASSTPVPTIQAQNATCPRNATCYTKDGTCNTGYITCSNSFNQTLCCQTNSTNTPH